MVPCFRIAILDNITAAAGLGRDVNLGKTSRILRSDWRGRI